MARAWTQAPYRLIIPRKGEIVNEFEEIKNKIGGFHRKKFPSQSGEALFVIIVKILIFVIFTVDSGKLQPDEDRDADQDAGAEKDHMLHRDAGHGLDRMGCLLNSGGRFFGRGFRVFMWYGIVALSSFWGFPCPG